MNLQRVFNVISPIFRRRRFRWFMDKVAPSAGDTILDVGGRPGTWTPHPPVGSRIDVLNTADENEQAEWVWDESEFESHNIHKLVGNACELDIEDNSYDIVFSNSVIEHVGTWENQERFAAEVRRVGGRLWIQTPAWEFFIEPHYITPFVHWVPRRVRKYVVRYLTVWAWASRPSMEEAQARVDEIRLLSYRELKKLFPDCQIVVERFLWVFPKSYVALRV